MSESGTENREDEIDLKDLLRSILDTKVVVVIAAAVVSILFWGMTFSKGLLLPTVHNHSIRIDLVFDGVSEREYPNGLPFSISDIIAPAVLDSVYTRNDLQALIGRNDFLNAFGVEPYTPERGLILQKYTSALDNRGLQQAEIESLQEQLKQELKQASISSVNIYFTYTDNSKLPIALISKILRDVADEWARLMTEDVGVLQIDMKMYTKKAINAELFDSLDYLIAFEMLLDKLNLLRENTDNIVLMPNGLLVRDENSGFSAVDLERAVNDIEKYVISPLFGPIKSMGIAKDIDVVKLYFENELRELSRQKGMLSSKKENVKEAYNAYISHGQGQIQRVAEGSNQPLGSSAMIPQIGAEFLDRIIEMTNAGADIDYRQSLNRQLIEIADEMVEVTADMERIEEIQAAIEGSGSAAQRPELRDLYTSKSKEELPKILVTLEGYFDVSTNLYQKISQEGLGKTGHLYRLIDGDVDYSASRTVLNTSNIRLYLIVLFLALVVITPFEVIRRSMRKN